jgi:hypothetical protein
MTINIDELLGLRGFVEGEHEDVISRIKSFYVSNYDVRSKKCFFGIWSQEVAKYLNGSTK